MTNCSDDSDDDDGNGGTSGASAGKGGSTAGKGGSSGTAGKGGSAGTAGKGGSAGTAGKGGSAGAAGAEEGGAPGAAGEGGAKAGSPGAAGSDAGAGGDAGMMAGAGGADSAGAPGTAGAGGEGGAAPLTDARILHVVITVDTGEVSVAQLALTRATAAAVTSFAEEMATEHGAAITRANTIGTEQTITPQDNSLSQMLAQESVETLAELDAVAAAEFDVAYMESQVAMHQDALTLIETELMPEADNAALVEFLEDIQAEVEAHLLDAETTLDAL